MLPPGTSPTVSLRPQQQAVVDAQGNFLLLACPGSGKTRSAAARTARLVNEQASKVAVCSYTNVGADRIGKTLRENFALTLGSEHFLGTVHKFLLRYVVHPFAHLLGAERGPSVREEGWPAVRINNDNAQRITLDAFRRRPNGDLVVSSQPRTVSGTPDEIIASVRDEVLRRKGEIFRRWGILSADDAMWIALALIRDNPTIAAAVARRFDEVLVDEAQDTSELQLACLGLLYKTGNLESLVLVGDLEQSIYSFQGASAEGCQQLAGECGLSTLTLSENHRSSQLICNVAVHFCDRTTPDVAVGQHADCEITPEVLLYPRARPASTIGMFHSRLKHHGLEQQSSVVLGRSLKLVDQINGSTALFKPGDRQHTMGTIAARLEAGCLGATDVREAERLLAYCAWDTTHLDGLSPAQRSALKMAVSDLFRGLPLLSGDVRTWLVSARTALQGAATSLTGNIAHSGGRVITTRSDHASVQAREVFVTTTSRLLAARTVHSFKGEDSDAVMVVIRRPHSDPTSQLELWEAAIGGTDLDPERAEERRVLFVALTRARRYCLVALPDDQRGIAVAETCDALGFQVVAPSL